MKKNGKKFYWIIAILIVLSLAAPVMAQSEPQSPTETEPPACTVTNFSGKLISENTSDTTARLLVSATWDNGPESATVRWDDFGGREDNYGRGNNPIHWDVDRRDDVYAVQVTFIVEEHGRTCFSQMKKVGVEAKPFQPTDPPPVPTCNKDNVSVKFGSNTATFTNIGAAGWAVFAVYDTHGFPNLQAGPQTLIGYSAQKLGTESKSLVVAEYDPSKDCNVQMDGMFVCKQSDIAATVPKKLTASNQGPQWNALLKAITRGSHVCEEPTPTPTPTDEPPTATPTDEPPTATPTDEPPTATPTDTPTDTPTATPTDVPTATPTGTLEPPTDTPVPTDTQEPTPSDTPTPADKSAREPECLDLKRTGYHANVKSFPGNKIFEVYHIVGDNRILVAEGVTSPANQWSEDIYIGKWIALGTGKLKAFIGKQNFTSADCEIPLGGWATTGLGPDLVGLIIAAVFVLLLLVGVIIFFTRKRMVA